MSATCCWGWPAMWAHFYGHGRKLLHMDLWDGRLLCRLGASCCSDCPFLEPNPVSVAWSEYWKVQGICGPERVIRRVGHFKFSILQAWDFGWHYSSSRCDPCAGQLPTISAKAWRWILHFSRCPPDEGPPLFCDFQPGKRGGCIWRGPLHNFGLCLMQYWGNKDCSRNFPGSGCLFLSDTPTQDKKHN